MVFQTGLQAKQRGKLQREGLGEDKIWATPDSYFYNILQICAFKGISRLRYNLNDIQIFRVLEQKKSIDPCRSICSKKTSIYQIQ